MSHLRPDRDTEGAAGRRTAQEGLVALDAISQLLTASAFDLEALLDEIVRTTARRMGVKASALRLVDEATGRLEVRSVAGLSTRFLTQGPAIGTDSRFRQLIENEGIFEMSDIREEPNPAFVQAARAEGIGALLAVGLYRDEDIIGALSVYTEQGRRFTDTEVRTLRVIANQASVALQLAQLHEAQIEKEWLERELDLAAEIQAGVLPKQMPALEGIHLAAWSEPWEQVGGDFYDFIGLPEANLGLAIGDVSGKGLSAALLMFTVRMALRSHVEHEYAMREIMRRVNRAIYRDTQPEQFATLFYGVLNSPSRILTYVNASHNPPLVFRGDTVMTLEEGGLPVGMFRGEVYRQMQIHLKPGDLLVFYTDGYTEVSRDDSSEMYGEERFCQEVRAYRERTPQEIIEHLNAALDAYLGDSQHGDDRTLVVMKVE